MADPSYFKTVIFTLFSLVSFASGGTILRNDETFIEVNREQLDPQGSYLLSWTVDLKLQKITFEVEAATLGYVGFGISPSGGMAGADLFIAGKFTNGSNYAYVS